jgi:multisubunit Na+/H+ antiporter MnhF subunit
VTTTELHPTASHHLPAFITAPGETDVLMVAMGVILVVAVLMFGVLFLRLHTLPERIAHKSHKLQFEIVAVLGLLALFTHMHIFWVAGLLLALIDFPDLGGWMGRIAGSVEKIAGTKSSDIEAQGPDQMTAGIKRGEGAGKMPHENIASIRRGDGVAPPRSELAPASTRG